MRVHVHHRRGAGYAVSWMVLASKMVLARDKNTISKALHPRYPSTHFDRRVFPLDQASGQEADSGQELEHSPASPRSRD